MITSNFRKRSRIRTKRKLSPKKQKQDDNIDVIKFVMNEGEPIIDSENPQPYSVKDNTIYLNFHQAQKKVWNSVKRYVVALGGTQSGKTSPSPAWLLREIQMQGAGDYLYVSPTYPLLSKKALPEVKKLFTTLLGLGKYVGGEKKMLILTKEGEKKVFGKEQEIPTQIFFGHAQDPDSLESATAKAAVLDECGQKKFKLPSFEAIKRRLAIFRGRILMPTTPYYLGWLKTKFWDVWQRSKGNHPEIDIIRFSSIDNPAFPKQEYEDAKRELPSWKFNMFYNALFTKAAGMIYGCFDETIHKTPRFNIPDDWKRYLGLDFGGVNTAGIFLAKEPTNNNLYIYREYHAGNLEIEGHVKQLNKDESTKPSFVSGGANSEDQWRMEIRKAGMPIVKPLISSVEVGIDKVYGAINNDRLLFFDDLHMILDEITAYSRKLDDLGQPTEAIENKNDYHLLDALRYIVPHADRQNAIRFSVS